jgi:hypothetical protein
MSRRRIAGTKEILLTGIPLDVTAELKSACRGRASTGRNWTYGELFMTEIYPIWKGASKAQPPQGRLSLGPAEVRDRESEHGVYQETAEKETPKTRRKAHGGR